MLKNPRLRFGLVTAALLCPALAGCGDQQMADQPSYRTFEPSDFFGDRRSAREPVPGTVARGQLRDDYLLFTGRTGPGVDFGDLFGMFPGIHIDAPLADTFPFEVTREVLERGQQRFNIFCVVCHGYTGQGNGKIVERGYVRPPSYHEKRLREAPVGHFFDVMTRGYGAMPDYRAEVPPRDRWAIAAYIRALQAREVSEDELTPEQRKQLPPRRQGGK
jgi:cytochrome c553